MRIQVVGHTSFLGHTGYNNHSRNFFTHLNKYIPTRVRNYTYCHDLSYLKDEERNLIIEQSFDKPPFKAGIPFIPNPNDLQVNIVLNESHHYFFYDHYESPMIAYNVWESTRQLPEYFNRVLQYDQFWCPTEWQRQCTIDQGYPADRVKVVPEGVNGQTFKPSTDASVKEQLYSKYNIPLDAFTFMIFGRWDTRKSTTEMVKAFVDTFGENKNAYLILSADNPFGSDGMESTEERLKHYKFERDNIKVLHFPPRKEYVQWMQHGDCILSCSRSEGWNLPLMEAIACGTVSICSDWGGHLEFADDVSHKVNVPKELPPKDVYMLGDNHDLGVWGEPDFDHLANVMTDVYRDFEKCQSYALKMSKFIRDLYTWDNAARKAEGHIRELTSTFKSIPKQPEKNFETVFEIVDGSPRVNFKSPTGYDGKLWIVIKNADGEERYETWFKKVEVDITYWVALNNPVDKITFEIFDEKLNRIYVETKSLNEIGTIRQEVVSGMELYQDQYINGKIISKGKRDCESRYEAMKQVFQKYERPFTILDIGANFGYYSIRAASEYDAVATMVENKNEEVKTLIDLCEKNDCRDKLTVIQTSVDLHKLKELSKCEHFDVVLALNIIHHFKEEEVIEICRVFTKLGDNLILETPPIEDSEACGQNNLKIITTYFSSKMGTKLGEFERHTSDTMSEMVWYETPRSDLKWPYYGYEKLFEDKSLDTERLINRGTNTIKSNFSQKKMSSTRREETHDWIPGINLRTFVELNGVYPSIHNLVEKLKTRDIHGDYKWDNSNNDLIMHNFILSGCVLHMIDFDDQLIERKVFNDQLQLDIVIDELRELQKDKTEKDKIKINLGCGNDIKLGYINIDRYNNTGNIDINADLGDLPFIDGSVDEIYCSHVFEHIAINIIYSIVEEWKRILKDDGALILRLPNLEHEINIWLNTPDDKKWGEVSRIFGSQSHVGNTHFCGFNPGSLKSFIECFDFEVVEVREQNLGHGNEIYMHARKKPTVQESNADYICHFVDGPYLEVKGEPTKNYFVSDFLDPDNDSSVHQELMNINQWTRPHRKYFTNWNIEVRRNGRLDFIHKFNVKGKRVLISFDTKSLGDTLAWIPYMEEFRKKHECKLYVSTFWNNLFQSQKQYSTLNFITPGSVVKDVYASYIVGCFDNNIHKNKTNWRAVPLQQVCSDVLGLEYKEIVPKMLLQENRKRKIEEKYVCLSEFSTFQCKLWNYPGAWQEIVDYLNELGYKVVVISKEKTKLKNIINKTGRSINETINTIRHCEFFLGVSAGPTWLAWTLDRPTVLISGYSARWGEFKTKIKRVVNEDVCHGCFNDPSVPLERGDWNWCPRQKGTLRQFECSKKINPDMVKKVIDEIVQDKWD